MHFLPSHSLCKSFFTFCIFYQCENQSWKRMDSGNDKKARTDVEVDRLSSLPDDLIHNILSFLDTKDAVETRALSSRWRFIWTRLPYLNFSTESFSTLHMFSKFFTHVLSRNRQTDLFSVKLNFVEKSNKKSSLVSIKRILNNALSRNVQQLTVTFLLWKCQIPLPLIFNSESLKHLRLEGYTELNTNKLTSIWHLPALTTLSLYRINLDNCHSVLALSPNLKNLIIGCCEVTESDGFCITNSQLLTLTLYKVTWHVKFVRVDTPQMKNLRITKLPKELTISAPDLTYLCFKGCYLPGHQIRLSADGLERADICMYFPDETETDVLKIFVLLQHVQSVKFLALSLEIVQFLSSSLEIISLETSPFSNLRSLKIYPALVKEGVQEKITISTQVKNYLLGSSPNATFTMVSHEEARTIEITKWAKDCMALFRSDLYKVKDNIKKNRACMDQQMAQVENQRQVAERMTDIMSKFGYFDVKIEQGRQDIGRIISQVEEIKGLLKKVLASKRVEMQAHFSSLCAEAESVVNKIIDNMKNQCDINRICCSGYFNECASTSQSSFRKL